MTEPRQETWLKLAVLTVIVMAAAAGISAFKASVYGSRVQIFTAREARLWQDYQVESIKKDNFAINRDILLSLRLSEGKAAKTPKTTAARIKEYEDEMGRLNRERDQIKKEAQTLAAQEDALAQKAGELGLAVILALGVWGLVYLVKNLVL
jgi:hypothetical protein